MTKKQVQQFNAMLGALTMIAKGYQTPRQLERNSKKQYGLGYTEALGMSYENIQICARNAIKGVKHI
jgi:hypothetical protein